MAYQQYGWNTAPQASPMMSRKTAPIDPMNPGAAPGQGQASQAGGPTLAPSQGARQAMGEMPSYSAMFAKGPQANKPIASYTDLVSGLGDQRQQNAQAAQANIAKGFQPTGEDPATQQARNAFIKSQEAATRKTMEDSVLAGRGQTGQSQGDLQQHLAQVAAPQRMDFEATMAAQQRQADTQRAQNAQTNFLNLENLGSNEQNQRAQLAQQDIAQQRQIASTEKQSAAQIASQEKLGMADLSIKEKSLAQAGQQFNDELSFKKYATDRGFTDAEAQRTWQALQNDKQIASTEKLGFAGLSIQEKKLAQDSQQFTDRLSFDKWATQAGLDDKTAERIWQSNENSLGRNLQQYVADKGFDIDTKKLEETVRQFDNKLDFDKWATQAGLDEQDKEMIWKSNEADVQRKFDSGQQLSTQEHQIRLQSLQGDIEKSKLQLQNTLGLQTLEQQHANDLDTAAVQNQYQVNRDNAAMSHDQAMEELKNSYATTLQQKGFDQQTATQAAEIYANTVQKQQDRDLSALQAKADLAYKYSALASQEGLSQQEINLKRDTLNQQMDLGLKQLGLDEKKVTAAIQSQQFQDRAGQIATFMEMAGDNADAMDRALKMYLDLLGDPSLPGGALLTPEEKKTALTGIDTASANDAKAKTEADKTAYQNANKNAYDVTKDATLGAVDQLAKGNILKSLELGVKNPVKLIDPRKWF